MHSLDNAMTRIALFLTAVPLALALATLLNLLLDRRLAAVARPDLIARRRAALRNGRLLPLLAVALLSAAPALATQGEAGVTDDGASIESALRADAESVERLWSVSTGDVVLIAQEPIPALGDTLIRSHDESGSRDGAHAASGDQPSRAPGAERTPSER